MNILLAEDEKSLSRALSAILTRNGCTVDTAFDGEEAMEHMEADSYDAVVLDIMMPKADGITVLKNIREKGNLTPVLMLTAKSEIDDKVTGLEAGANDYLTKPFNSRELMARLQAITRANTFQNHPKLSFGNVTINRETFELSTPTGGLRLSNKEFGMLEIMMTNPKSRISAERFKERLWKDDSEAPETIAHIYISYLSKKLAYLNADIKINETENHEYGLEKIK
ncbi:MAG: response regulator transcription factor [Clostridiales bacterium]|nr:response regulator transcription factor [Clostridiales bacterium]